MGEGLCNSNELVPWQASLFDLLGLGDWVMYTGALLLLLV